MLTHAAWVNLRKGKIEISLGNEQNHLGKEQDYFFNITLKIVSYILTTFVV